MPVAHGILLFLVALLTAGWPSVLAETPRKSSLEGAIEQALLPAATVQGEPAVLTLADRMAWYNVPAISVAVIDGGELVFAKAYGENITTNTLFQSASISKPVTAIGVMRLMDMGELDLDTDINRYLTSWKLPKGAQTSEKPATIRGILSHTAGFTVHGFAGYGPGEALPTLVQILNGTAPANSGVIFIDQTPGTDWRYSGGGYVVLQQILEDITGTDFSDLMQAEVLNQVGMTGSSFAQPLPAAMQVRQAKAHDHAGRERPTHVYPEEAPAGLWTTPTDLSRLLISVMDSFQGKPGILSPESTRDMAAQVTDGMGLGFASDGEGNSLRLSHGGSNQGFKALMFAYPDRGQGMVLMTNADGGTFLQLEVARALAAHFDWPDMTPRTVEGHVVAPDMLADYASRYVDASTRFDVTVTVQEDGLMLQAARGSRYLAYPTGANTFVTRESGSEVVMGTAEDGTATLTLWGMTALKLD